MRFARLGLIDGFEAELVVAGINHGANLGDDITYSGTVAAALEGIVLGLPAIAVSQQSRAREMDFRLGGSFDFDVAAAFVARIVEELERVPLPPGTLLNINVPAGEPAGVEVTRLGKRIYRDELTLDGGGRGHGPRATGSTATTRATTTRPGTDLAAVAAGRIAVTPLHFDLTARARASTRCAASTSTRLLAPAAAEIE